jgi:hypothetical protein
MQSCRFWMLLPLPVRCTVLFYSRVDYRTGKYVLILEGVFEYQSYLERVPDLVCTVLPRKVFIRLYRNGKYIRVPVSSHFLSGFTYWPHRVRQGVAIVRAGEVLEQPYRFRFGTTQTRTHTIINNTLFSNNNKQHLDNVLCTVRSGWISGWKTTITLTTIDEPWRRRLARQLMPALSLTQIRLSFATRMSF